MDSLSSHQVHFETVFKYLFPSAPGDRYPALTAGISVFFIIIFFFSFYDINEGLYLYPKALIHFQLGRLSNYPLGHTSVLHLILNIVCLYGPLLRFELIHGTVYTGIVLNILAVSTAIPFCILGMLFYPDVKVLGSSGWVFSFIAYFAVRESLNMPLIKLNNNFGIPTRYFPVFILLLTTILVPGSSFWGHFFGMVSGYLLSYGYLNRFIVPPTVKIVPFIEDKLDFLIKLIPSKFWYIKEKSIITQRDNFYKKNNDGRSIIPLTDMTKKMSVPPTPINTNTPSFPGSGSVLGGNQN